MKTRAKIRTNFAAGPKLLTRPSATLSLSDGERDGVRGLPKIFMCVDALLPYRVVDSQHSPFRLPLFTIFRLFFLLPLAPFWARGYIRKASNIKTLCHVRGGNPSTRARFSVLSWGA